MADFFYHNLDTGRAIAFHKIAAKFLEDEIKKARLAGKPFVPEHLGEAGRLAQTFFLTQVYACEPRRFT